MKADPNTKPRVRVRGRTRAWMAGVEYWIEMRRDGFAVRPLGGRTTSQVPLQQVIRDVADAIAHCAAEKRQAAGRRRRRNRDRGQGVLL